MNKRLLDKLVFANIEKILKNKNYIFYNRGYYNLNIIGIRSNNDNKVTNLYDDLLLLSYKNNNGWQIRTYPITTEPGKYYVTNKLLNPKGCAILVPGQYISCYQIGKHNGKYNALVQVKPVKVYRDNNKDDIYDLDPKTIENGCFGINIHRSNENFTRKTVDMYSAGCQVFANPNDFNNFMAICKKQSLMYGNSFTYTLINEEDLI